MTPSPPCLKMIRKTLPRSGVYSGGMHGHSVRAVNEPDLRKLSVRGYLS
jgi:hypothetical protein